MTTHRFPLFRLVLLAAGIAAHPAHATGGLEQSVAASARTWLRDHAEQQHLGDTRVEAMVLPLAPRRAAPPSPCNAPAIEPADTKHIERMRFSVRCEGLQRPTIYIVRGAIFAKVWVAALAIPTGKLLARDDVTLEERNWAKTPDAITDLAQLEGRTSRRAMKPGQIVRKRYLKGGESVKRGQDVRIVARHAQVEVSSAGTALEDGMTGETIRVRNTRTGRIIAARIAGPGTVEPLNSGAQ